MLQKHENSINPQKMLWNGRKCENVSETRVADMKVEKTKTTAKSIENA